eukprot:163668-Chlamydomonas_euryale.AAC.6
MRSAEGVTKPYTQNETTSKLKVDSGSTLEEDAPKAKQIGSQSRGCDAKIGREGVVRDDETLCKVLQFACKRTRGPCGRVLRGWVKGRDAQLGGEVLAWGGAPQALDLCLDPACEPHGDSPV